MRDFGTVYDVRFVKTGELPQGFDWFIARCEDGYVFMVDPTALTEETLKDAWVSYVRLSNGGPH